MTGSDNPEPLPQIKARLRVEARAARARVPDPVAAAQALVRQFELSTWSLSAAGAVTAGYWPIGSEIDCRPLLRRLRADGVQVVLPAVERRDAPLVFRLWDGGTPGARDLGDMAVPGRDADQRVPDILLVPLLLVDRAGHRLGYGGGYYDRTLKELRHQGRVTAIGLAFDEQLTDKLPVGADDMMLDGVITPTGWHVFGG